MHPFPAIVLLATLPAQAAGYAPRPDLEAGRYLKALGEAEERLKQEPDNALAWAAKAQALTALVRLPLAEVRHIHRQETTAIGTRLTHRIEISGPLSWLYGWSLGRRLRDDLAPSMRRLARLAS